MENIIRESKGMEALDDAELEAVTGGLDDEEIELLYRLFSMQLDGTLPEDKKDYLQRMLEEHYNELPDWFFN